MALSPADFFAGARFEPAALAVVVGAGAWYARQLRRLSTAGRSWPAGRTASFAVAELLLVVATCSGLPSFAPANFSASVAGFVMAGMLAPALLALSSPLRLALLAHPGRANPFEGRWAALMLHPVVTWVPFPAALFTVFLTGLYTRVVSGGAAEQAVFLVLVVCGYLYYAPAVDSDPLPHRLGYWPRVANQLLMFPAYTILGMALESQSTRISPATSPASLHLGAAVLWVAGETVSLIGAMWIFVQWLRHDQRRAETHDQAHREAAERQLAVWRAARQAAARAAGPPTA